MNEKKIIPESTLAEINAAQIILLESEQSGNKLYFTIQVMFQHTGTFTNWIVKSDSGSNGLLTQIERLKNQNTIRYVRIIFYSSPSPNNTKNMFDTGQMPFFTHVKQDESGQWQPIQPLNGYPESERELNELKLINQQLIFENQRVIDQLNRDKDDLSRDLERVLTELEAYKKATQAFDATLERLEERHNTECEQKDKVIAELTAQVQTFEKQGFRGLNGINVQDFLQDLMGNLAYGFGGQLAQSAFHKMPSGFQGMPNNNNTNQTQQPLEDTPIVEI